MSTTADGDRRRGRCSRREMFASFEDEAADGSLGRAFLCQQAKAASSRQHSKTLRDDEDAGWG